MILGMIQTNRFNAFFERGTNFYIVLLLAMLVRSFPFGFYYFPFSDDFNAYGVYSLYHENLWSNVVIPYVLYGFRPLAGLLDAYVVSRFWPNLAVVLLAITLLQFATIVLLDKVLTRCGIVWGRAAAVFFAFFPTLTESVYWISASARIVTSAFFALLAGYAILKFIHREGRYRLWLAVALCAGLLAQGFYEQGIVFAFVVTFGVLVLHWRAVRPRALFVWPFVNLAIIGTHYVFFREVSQLGPRAQAADNIFAQIPLVADRIFTTFVREQGPTILNTFRWGFGQMFTEYLPLTMLVLLFSALLALFVVFERHEPPLSRRAAGRSALAGLALAGSTLMIFFVLAESWVWVRNFFFTVIGIAVFVELVARVVRSTRLRVTVGKAVAAFLAIFLFFSGFVLEIDSIRRVERYDRQIVAHLIDEVARLRPGDEVDRVWLFGVQWVYGPTINQRITSQVRLDWALDGYYLALTGTRAEQRAWWLRPVMDGQDTDIDFTHDILLGLDLGADGQRPLLRVRELRFEDGALVFADTGEVFGLIDQDGIFTQS